MVEVTGFEPATFWSRTKRATKLRYTSIYGANEGTRTPDLLITNRLLYQLSYIGKVISSTLVIITYLKGFCPYEIRGFGTFNNAPAAAKMLQPEENYAVWIAFSTGNFFNLKKKQIRWTALVRIQDTG